MKRLIKSRVIHYVMGYGIAWFIIWLLFCIVKDNVIK